MAKWQPQGYHSVTPFLNMRNAARAIEVYQKAFGARQLSRMDGPGGKVMHAELKIGDSVVMISDEFPEMGIHSPEGLGGATGGLMIYVENCDAAFERAVAAGFTPQDPPRDQFWGDRYARLVDPFGHRWALATHVRDVAPEEMKRAMDEWMKQQASQEKR